MTIELYKSIMTQAHFASIYLDARKITDDHDAMTFFFPTQQKTGKNSSTQRRRRAAPRQRKRKSGNTTQQKEETKQHHQKEQETTTTPKEREKGCLQGFVCKFNPSDCLSLACCSFFFRAVYNFRLCRCSLSWWRASLPSSLGPQRWDARTETLSNNALLEVIAQLKLQNQELMGLLAQQSSRDPGRSSGGFRMETKPLDMVDPASVSTAWDMVMKKKE